MKNKYVRLLLLALTGASAVFGVKVITDYNHAVDFSQYHTYSWLKVEAGDSLWSDRITHAVDSELSAKGWSMVPVDGDALGCRFRFHSQSAAAGNLLHGFWWRMVLARMA